ncbi:MAG: NADH-quinone oxidoreductase subunit L [Deltaproteobacteria bacterium]|nr:NADH-quinone oxidoreductase subunit L [Deltaproteobacteria bacterium]
MESSGLTENLGLLRLIPLIPLLGSVLNIFLGRRLGSKVAGLLACVAVGLSFLLSVWVFLSLPVGKIYKDSLFTWIESGLFKVEISFQADPLTVIMLLVITGIGLLIHIYSLGYMGQDEGMVRYFSYLNLFVFFMLLLVMADNLLLLFVGWEGVGLCSYLLIGFWYQDHKNTIAGNKAFIVNRIGDFCFLLGILLLFWEMGRHGVWTLEFLELKRNAHLLSPGSLTLITLLLFGGATGKSAQIPLFVWLPDAMQGPTPVSALIHAATMVTAGVYMMARLYFLFSLAPATLTIIAIVGALTALSAATIALVQNDIKRVLAYSTISQLGYMFLAVGVGAYSAAIFHLFTHAFFKACLFLCAGSVIHALGGEQDMRKMGGLRHAMPYTFWTFTLAVLAITGTPLTAGFFSKDEILWQAFSSPNGSRLLWGVGVATAGLTAFYMFRQFFLVFFGESRVDNQVKAHLHESPKVMTYPLVILAIGSLVAGWVGLPAIFGGSRFEEWLEPVLGGHTEGHGSAALEGILMAFSVAVASAGFLLAYLLYYRRTLSPERLSSWAAGLPYRLALNKYYIDEIYDSLLVRPFTACATWFSDTFDVTVIDQSINAIAARVRASSLLWRQLQTGNVQHYLLGVLTGTLLILSYYLFR